MRNVALRILEMSALIGSDCCFYRGHRAQGFTKGERVLACYEKSSLEAVVVGVIGDGEEVLVCFAKAEIVDRFIQSQAAGPKQSTERRPADNPEAPSLL